MNHDSESNESLSGDWQRVVSLVIAIAYLVLSPIIFPAASWSHLMADMLIRIVALSLPLAFIWFAEDLAEYRDGTLFPSITGSSPEKFVRLGGWILLLLPVLVFLLVRLFESLYLR